MAYRILVSLDQCIVFAVAGDVPQQDVLIERARRDVLRARGRAQNERLEESLESIAKCIPCLSPVYV